MPTLTEIKALAYGLLAALIFGGGVYVGDKHVTAMWNIDKLAQASALAKAQTDLTTALADRIQLQQQVATKDAQLKASGDALVSNVNVSLRNVETALRASTLFGAVGNSGAGKGTGTVPGGNSELESAFTAVGDAIAQASAACLHDSRELSDIQMAAPKQAAAPRPAK